MQLSAFVFLACALAAAARPIGGDGAKVEAPVPAGNERGRTVKRDTTKLARRSYSGSLGSYARPFVNGIANPLLQGLGHGVAGAAAGTQQTTDHTLGGIMSNAEQGAGVAVANTGHAVQSEISDIGNNSGVLGSVIRTTFGGGKRRLTRRRGDVGTPRTRPQSSSEFSSHLRSAHVDGYHSAVTETYLSDAEDSDGESESNRVTRSRGIARRARRRSLAGDIQPVMGAINPLAQGLDAGLQQGAGNIKAAVQNAGAALNQAAGYASDVGANTVACANKPFKRGWAKLPAKLLIVQALEYGGLTGSILGTAFGHRSNEASDNENDSAPLGAVSKPAGSDAPARRARRRGMDAGLQQGAGNIKAAVQNAGAALDQAANGVADVANTAAGAGQTVGQVPGAALKTVHSIDHAPGIIGSVDSTIFGH
ncbi:hypothetical protein HWV62_1693 [Athelia sp. TMB]|nr:hypothetical protein HWV62_1693 [Athelia sp. TMB]